MFKWICLYLEGRLLCWLVNSILSYNCLSKHIVLAEFLYCIITYSSLLNSLGLLLLLWVHHRLWEQRDRHHKHDIDHKRQIRSESWLSPKVIKTTITITLRQDRDLPPSGRCCSGGFPRKELLSDRPERWSIFQSDGMVNVFFQATIDFNGFSMVLTTLDHHHWMFFEGPTIGINGFSMVFKILKAMVNDG